MTQPGPPKLLTMREVIKVLRVSSAHAYAMVKRQELPVVRLGRRVMVLEEDLVAFIRARRQPARER